MYRTNFFMKENKYYSEFSFWLPLGYILALGLFFTEEREGGPRALNREQTDEWRGLMQAVVLIYHVTGARNVLPIYMHLRLINSAYLFLSGYGHFCYFWQRGDVSLVRFARVSRRAKNSSFRCIESKKQSIVKSNRSAVSRRFFSG